MYWRKEEAGWNPALGNVDSVESEGEYLVSLFVLFCSTPPPLAYTHRVAVKFIM